MRMFLLLYFVLFFSFYPAGEKIWRFNLLSWGRPIKTAVYTYLPVTAFSKSNYNHRVIRGPYFKTGNGFAIFLCSADGRCWGGLGSGGGGCDANKNYIMQRMPQKQNKTLTVRI